MKIGFFIWNNHRWSKGWSFQEAIDNFGKLSFETHTSVQLYECADEAEFKHFGDNRCVPKFAKRLTEFQIPSNIFRIRDLAELANNWLDIKDYGSYRSSAERDEQIEKVYLSFTEGWTSIPDELVEQLDER